MLTCEQVTAKASAFVDGEVSLRERVGIRLHLAICVHCRGFLRLFRLLITRLSRQDEDVEVSEQLVAQVLNAIDSSETAPH
ncbi:MAG: zf-HC2 domain-containing protein [Gemmatimonadales bacterium]|jgi:predicted anti-sigma-YlaC factor YlaD